MKPAWSTASLWWSVSVRKRSSRHGSVLWTRHHAVQWTHADFWPLEVRTAVHLRIFLPFSSDPLSAFTSLADIELNDPIVGSPDLTALFTDDHGAPFTGHFLDRLLHGLLLRHFPESVAKNYSWHSCRIWLATALLASGASRAQIQALCRWQTDESLNVYACLQGAEQYSRLLAGAFGVRIDAARAATLAEAAPFICRHDVLAATGAARVLADADIDADLAPHDDADDD